MIWELMKLTGSSLVAPLPKVQVWLLDLNLENHCDHIMSRSIPILSQVSLLIAVAAWNVIKQNTTRKL
jgi:hypothetical protein